MKNTNSIYKHSICIISVLGKIVGQALQTNLKIILVAFAFLSWYRQKNSETI